MRQTLEILPGRLRFFAGQQIFEFDRVEDLGQTVAPRQLSVLWNIEFLKVIDGEPNAYSHPQFEFFGNWGLERALAQDYLEKLWALDFCVEDFMDPRRVLEKFQPSFLYLGRTRSFLYEDGSLRELHFSVDALENAYVGKFGIDHFEASRALKTQGLECSAAELTIKGRVVGWREKMELLASPLEDLVAELRRSIDRGGYHLGGEGADIPGISDYLQAEHPGLLSQTPVLSLTNRPRCFADQLILASTASESRTTWRQRFRSFRDWINDLSK